MCSEESFIALTEIAVTEEILLSFDLSLHSNLHILSIYNDIYYYIYWICNMNMNIEYIATCTEGNRSIRRGCWYQTDCNLVNLRYLLTLCPLHHDHEKASCCKLLLGTIIEPVGMMFATAWSIPTTFSVTPVSGNIRFAVLPSDANG